MKRYILPAVTAILVITVAWLVTDRIQTQAKLAELSAKLTDLSVKAAQVDTYAAEITELKVSTEFQRMAHLIEGAYVTEDFVLTRINAHEDGDKLESLGVNLDLQPKMVAAYKNSGQFTISDRELRAKLLPIAEQVAKYYAQYPELPTWTDKSAVKLSVKNYDVAVYENGELRLVGEK